MWRIYKAAGKEFPDFCEDDVVNYMILEAVALKAAKEDRAAEREKEVADWKEDKGGLDKLREAAYG